MAKFSIGMIFLQVVRIILLLQSVQAHHTVALSMYAQFSLRDRRALSNQNSSECPSVWFEYNQVTHDCKCIDHLFLKCEGERVYADTRHILTYDYTIYNEKYFQKVSFCVITHLIGQNGRAV